MCDTIYSVIRRIKVLNMLKFHAISVFRMFAVSQIQFVAQLRSQPKILRSIDKDSIVGVIGGPGLWVECLVFFSI